MLEEDVALRGISFPYLPFLGNGRQVLHGQGQSIVGDLLLKNTCICWSMSPPVLTVLDKRGAKLDVERCSLQEPCAKIAVDQSLECVD